MSLGTVFPDGRIAPVSRGLIHLDSLADTEHLQDAWLDTWAEDVRFVLSEMLAMSAYPSDPERVGILGHSFGGATAALAMIRDPRLRAGANLDGPLWSAVMPSVLRRPFLLLAGERGEMGEAIAKTPPEQIAMLHTTREIIESRNRSLRRRQLRFIDRGGDDFYWLEVRNATHLDFFDAPFWVRGLPGFPDSDRMHRLVSDYVLTFFDRYLRGNSDSRLEELSERYTEVQDLAARIPAASGDDFRLIDSRALR